MLCLSRLMLLLIFALPGSTNANQGAEVPEKLEAFARTFGYVRYFHPSDQASLVDWEAMAFYGIQQMRDSPEDETVEQFLTRVYGPLVVDLELYRGVEKPRPETKKVDAKTIVAWQHVGVGLEQQGLYRSARLNRQTKTDAAASPFGNLMQQVDPSELRDRDIRFSFDARVEKGRCRLQGWFRVDRESKKRGLFDNMNDRPISNREWKRYELTGKVDNDANNLVFGVMFMGSGSALVDNVSLEVQKTARDAESEWETIDVPNHNFEDDGATISGWLTLGDGYGFESTDRDATSGKQAAAIRRISKTETRKLFDEVPKLGEVVDVPIVGDLRLRMPLVLPVDAKYSRGDDATTDELIAAVNEFDVDASTDSQLAVANVILLWNVFQHFYPYFEQVETDWDKVLRSSLVYALKANDRGSCTKTLQRLVAGLHDGHGGVYDMRSQRMLAPVLFAWIEEKLVVVASESTEFEVGEVVSEIDGIFAADYLENREFLISGSPQWKRYQSTQRLSMGTKPIDLTIERDGEEKTITLEYTNRQPLQIDKGEVCRIEVEGDDDSENIWYIDMGRAEPDDLNPLLDRFAAAKGIVLDFRGYPRGTQFLFQHMTDRHMQSQQWQVPRQLRPDRVDMQRIETMGRWEMPPKRPRFAGKMVFITDASAISYAESCMAIVAHYKLGEIIGSPTAGANGNVNPFGLPGGYRVAWTGMRVMNHDDSQHHVRGVQPTIPMKPTIEGIRSGRDELLEKAISLISE